MFYAIEYIRKTTKWYKKFFFHFIDLSAFHLYKHKTHNNIRLQLIRQIIEMYGKSKVQRNRPRYEENPNRLIGRLYRQQQQENNACVIQQQELFPDTNVLRLSVFTIEIFLIVYSLYLRINTWLSIWLILATVTSFSKD